MKYSLSSERALDFRSEVDALLAILRFDEVLALYDSYVQTSAEVQALSTYLRSAEFRAAWIVVTQHPQMLEVYNFGFVRGVDIAGSIDRLAERLGHPLVPRSIPTQRTVRDFITELYTIVDVDGLITLLGQQGQAGGDMSLLLGRLATSQSGVLDDPAVATVGQALRGFGIDIDLIRQRIRDLLNSVPV